MIHRLWSIETGSRLDHLVFNLIWYVMLTITDPFQFHKYRYSSNNNTFPESKFLKIEILQTDLSKIFEQKGCYRFYGFVQGFTGIWRRSIILTWNFYHSSHKQFITSSHKPWPDLYLDIIILKGHIKGEWVKAKVRGRPVNHLFILINFYSRPQKKKLSLWNFWQ